MDEYVYQQPFQPEPPARRFPLTPVLAAAGALLVVGGGVWIWQMRGASTRQLLVQREQAVQGEVDRTQTACADSADPASCQKSLLDQAAQSMKAPDACRTLTDQAAVNDCIWGVALASEDREVCKGISDKTAQATCADSVLLRAAIASGDESSCARIADQQARANCAEVVAPTTAANCVVRGKSAEECAARTAIAAAAEKRDPSLCASVAEAYQPLCLELVVADADLDNLTDADESLYGSDPRKADTDGDGFNDGDEVKNGYNPAGPGPLEAARR